MAEVQRFRSAFNGFNREDVVKYVEYLNNQHRAEVERLTAQLQAAHNELALLKSQQAPQEAAPVQEEPVPSDLNMEELEAYRRAERVEREAKERAQKIHAKTNAVLADVTAKAEEASAKVSGLAEQMSSQMEAYQRSILDTKDAFQDAVAALNAVDTNEEI